MTNQYQNRLAELLKKKGIGPAGSKSLKQEELQEVGELFQNNQVSLTTKATILTALLLLEPTETEATFVQQLKESSNHYLPTELQAFLQTKSKNPFLYLILKNIKREDLTSEECALAMDFFFSNSENYLQAAFLEAQRLKRETFTENHAFFNAFWGRSQRVTIELPYLIDISNNYDGNIRTKNYSLLTTLLLAKANIPTIIHGLEKVAPKNGLTLHQILQQIDQNPLLSLKQAKEKLQKETWAYIDQQIAFPTLAQKIQMREEMVKRPFIATFEKLLQPIQVPKGNYVVTGYTHKHYKQEVPKLLKELGKCAKALIVKGEEGSSQLPLHKASEYVFFDGNTIKEQIVSPQDFGIEPIANPDKTEVTAEKVIQNMKDALVGKNYYVKYQVIYNAAVIIKTFGIDHSESLISTLEKQFHQIEL